MNCIIVDDETLAVELLKTHVSKVPNLKLCGTSSNAMNVYALLEKNDIDLIFLDIKLPDLNGTELLKTIDKKHKIVFTTAFREYAVESYNLNALDYLLKPISFTRFLQSVEKFKQVKSNNPLETIKPQNDIEDSYIFIRVDRKMVKVNFEDIIRIEALKDYSKIYTEKQCYVTQKNLRFFEKSLDTKKFIRIHKSHLIAFSKVKSYSSTFVNLQQKTLPIGRTYKMNFLKRLY